MAAPVRTCLACRRPAAKGALIRLVSEHGDGAPGRIVLDRAARRPGRGAYLCPEARCLEGALRRSGAALARALRLEGGRVDEHVALALRADWASAVPAAGVDEDAGERRGEDPEGSTSAQAGGDRPPAGDEATAGRRGGGPRPPRGGAGAPPAKEATVRRQQGEAA